MSILPVTTKDLDKKYDEFFCPHLSIKINGTEVTADEKVLCRKVSVIVTSGYESNICRVDLADMESKLVNSKIEHSKSLSGISVGSKIEVFMGYKCGNTKTLKRVFAGNIMTLDFSVEHPMRAVYHIEAMDVKVAMMGNCRSILRSKPDSETNKYSEAVSTVLDSYKSLDIKTNVKTTFTTEAPIEQHKQSDYDFIVSIAKKINHLFFISYDDSNVTANFVSYSDCNECVLKVIPDNHVLGFNREVSLSGQISGVTVRCNNKTDPTSPIEATVKLSEVETIGSGSKTSDKLSKTIVNDDTIKLIIDQSATSVEAVKQIAKAELTRTSMNLVGGQIMTLGIPELEAGKYIEVSGFSQDADKKYFITQVEHIFTPTGYRTICKIGANKL